MEPTSYRDHAVHGRFVCMAPDDMDRLMPVYVADDLALLMEWLEGFDNMGARSKVSGYQLASRTRIFLVSSEDDGRVEVTEEIAADQAEAWAEHNMDCDTDEHHFPAFSQAWGDDAISEILGEYTAAIHAANDERDVFYSHANRGTNV